jgi:hypothetical protein
LIQGGAFEGSHRKEKFSLVGLFPSSTLPSGRSRHSASFRCRKTAYTLETVQDRRKMLSEHEEETVVALSTGDVTSGLGRFLAVEIDITPKSTTKKTSITLKRFMLGKKQVLNTNRKLVELSNDDVTSGLARPLAA